jgi:hypothetical protein
MGVQVGSRLRDGNNRGPPESALVLRPDGLLYLAFRLYVHEGTGRWAQNWARNLVAEQFIMARDVWDRLAGLGGFDGFGGGAVSLRGRPGPPIGAERVAQRPQRDTKQHNVLDQELAEP